MCLIKSSSLDGWGKLYSKSGDIIIGQFAEGEVYGKFFCGRPDGTYYEGKIYNRKMTCEKGIYYCSKFQYIGGFK